MTSLMSTPTPEMAEVLRAVVAERLAQDEKWGVQDHDAEVWHLVISEELGEVAEAILDLRARIQITPDKLRAEVVQVAASAVAMVEWLDRREKDL